LLRVKERVDEPSTVRQICNVLIPKEFTKLDQIIDLVFSTTEDLEEEAFEETAQAETLMEADGRRSSPVGFHEACVERIQSHLATSLVKQSRTTYRSVDESLAAVCAVSRRYETGSNYWFGFHPYQQDSMVEVPQGWVCLGCGSPERLLLIPRDDFLSWLPDMNVTRTDARMYWHVSIFEEGTRLVLHRRAGTSRVDLSEYLI
jgi:hypothetical protein